MIFETVEYLPYFKEIGYTNKRLLEVSTASEEAIGRKLSAMNLSVTFEDGKKVTLESLYQSSKVYDDGMLNKHLLYKNGFKALRESCRKPLIGFATPWEDNLLLTSEDNPKPLYYNWIYFNFVMYNIEEVRRLTEYGAFIDSFYRARSYACQAQAVAIVNALLRWNIVKPGVLLSIGEYSDIVYGHKPVIIER